MKRKFLRSSNSLAFISLVKAGLWKKEARLSCYAPFDFVAVFNMAKEQTVLGLLMEGIDFWKKQDDYNPDLLPYRLLLKWIPLLHKTEQKNLQMNAFIERLFRFLEKNQIDAVLMKGQGIAQCYDNPLWRTCGDIDLMLDEDNYRKAKLSLAPMITSVVEESSYLLHYGMSLKGGFIVELHGTMRTRLSRKIDGFVDKIQTETLGSHKVRIWQNGQTGIPLPSPDEDVLFCFTHILHHLFIEGVGLRQICDWCRLLWTYRHDLDVSLLESRLRQMKILSEWKAFAALAVDWLGMEETAVPLYDGSRKWGKKASRLLSLIFETGNMGRKRDTGEGRGFIGRLIRLRLRTWDCIRFIPIFPIDAIRLWIGMVATAKKH